MRRSVQTYLIGESGAAKIEKVFAIAAGVIVCAVAAFLFFNSDAEQQGNTGRPSAEDVAVSELLDGRIRSFSARDVRVRFERYANPASRTDAQLRNAHRTWARRVADAAYNDPDRASDMLHIISAAMELRGVEPHQDI